jgi:hypothetical protein
MVQCPSCESRRVVIIVSVKEPRRALCVTCGSRWLERGTRREHVERVGRVERVEVQRVERVERVQRVPEHPSRPWTMRYPRLSS